MQEDDRAGRPPDSSLTFPRSNTFVFVFVFVIILITIAIVNHHNNSLHREFALTAGWLGLPEVIPDTPTLCLLRSFCVI